MPEIMSAAHQLWTAWTYVMARHLLCEQISSCFCTAKDMKVFCHSGHPGVLRLQRNVGEQITYLHQLLTAMECPPAIKDLFSVYSTVTICLQ